MNRRDDVWMGSVSRLGKAPQLLEGDRKNTDVPLHVGIGRHREDRHYLCNGRKEGGRAACRAREVYKAPDMRARALKRKDRRGSYSYAVCQSFAPTTHSIVTPQRIANCGAINWFDGKAAFKLDPEGPVQRIEKGELLDPIRVETPAATRLPPKNPWGPIPGYTCTALSLIRILPAGVSRPYVFTFLKQTLSA